MPYVRYDKFAKQDELRRLCRIVKAEEIYSYHEIAQIIDMNYNAFCNFMNRSRNLSIQKAIDLKSLCDDVLI